MFWNCDNAESRYTPILDPAQKQKRYRRRDVQMLFLFSISILLFVFLNYNRSGYTSNELTLNSDAAVLQTYVPGSHTLPWVKVGVHPNPPAKEIVKQMDWYISNHVAWNNLEDWSELMHAFFVADFNYVANHGLGTFTGIENWFYGEHIPFNFAFPDVTFSQLIFIGDETTASTTTYAKGTWKNQFVGVPPTDKVVSIRIHDFYTVDPVKKKIITNWMMIDVVDLMLQGGYRVLPKPRAREGWFQAPRAMDGIPAPIAFPSLDACCPKDEFEAIVRNVMHKEWVLQDSDASMWSGDMIFYGPGGIGFMPNKEWYISDFLKPFHEAFSEPEIETYVLLCQRNYCAMNGVLRGVQTGTWLGESAVPNMRRELRFGSHFRINIDTRKIEDGYLMFDLPHYFAQAGVELLHRTTAEYHV